MKPWRAPSAEEALIGAAPARRPSPRPAEVEPSPALAATAHNDFKIPLAQRTLKAVLAAATRTA